MNCEIIREQLLDAVEGTAPAAVQAHLDGCPACAGRLAELRQTMALLEEWRAPEVSPYFDSRLQARLRAEQQAPARSAWAWLGFKPVAAALALLLVASVALLNTGEVPMPDGDVAAVDMVVSSELPSEAADSAVADLATLDANDEMLADFELLDHIEEERENGS